MDFNIESEYKLSKKRKQKSPKGSFVSFGLLLPVGQWVYDKSRVRKPQAARVETNTNHPNLPNIDKALKQKSRRLKIRVIRIIRVRKNLKQFVVKII